MTVSMKAAIFASAVSTKTYAFRPTLNAPVP